MGWRRGTVSTLFGLLLAAPVAAQEVRLPGAREIEGPPALPTGSRRSLRPTALRSLTGTFVAEVGVGIVHHADSLQETPVTSPEVVALHRAIKQRFDPSGRLNPGVDVLLLPGGAS